ncbi:hypothetical protein Tco_0588188 [Tanacetum coccineum]
MRDNDLSFFFSVNGAGDVPDCSYVSWGLHDAQTFTGDVSTKKKPCKYIRAVYGSRVRISISLRNRKDKLAKDGLLSRAEIPKLKYLDARSRLLSPKRVRVTGLRMEQYILVIVSMNTPGVRPDKGGITLRNRLAPVVQNRRAFGDLQDAGMLPGKPGARTSQISCTVLKGTAKGLKQAPQVGN